MTYDKNYNLLTVASPTGANFYDEVGRVQKVTNALGKTMEYTYDKTGNVTRYKDYAGNVTEYVYDDMDRVIKKTVDDNDTQYSYDDKGLLAEVTDKSGTVKYQYDSYNRLIKQTDVNNITLSYTYDEEGRVKTFDNGFGKTDYEYDVLDRVTKVIDRNGKATLYEYDSLGNRSEVRYPNGNVVTYEYDVCNRLKEECITNASGVQLSKYTYGIGKAGERTSVTEINSGVETDITYKYDKLNRLTKETVERNGNKLTYEYSYDAVSNRTEKKVTVKGDISELADIDIEEVELTEGTTTYKYNALNQLISEETTDGTKIYTYDDNGNLVRQTGDKTVDYSYDKENHLVKATIQKGNSVTIESYTYDYAGNRLSKTVNESNITLYVNDTTTDLTQVVAETDNVGNETAYYTRGDELLSMEKAGEVCYYLYDGHGNVRTLTNEAGRITDRYSYDAYGSLLEKEGDTENEFLYTGEQYNANTGLYYLRARYMNPSTGIFISMDSYQGSIYDPVSLHKYLYANANPVMYSDPSGYSSVAEASVYMDGMGSLAAVEAYYNAMIFCVGMRIMAQLRAVSVVESTVHVSTQIILDDAFSGKNSTRNITTELLMKSVDAITFSYLIAKDCVALGVVKTSIDIAKAEVESLAVPLDRNKEYSGYSVYVLVDSENNFEVSYVGITNDPTRRANEHARDIRKSTNGIPWAMKIIKSDLTKEQARAIEQSLICIYTIDALANARYEIAEKNYSKFEMEFHRAAELVKMPLDDLYSAMIKSKGR